MASPLVSCSWRLHLLSGGVRMRVVLSSLGSEGVSRATWSK